MAEIRFEIAKKLPKPPKGAAGTALRSLDIGGAEDQILVFSDEYKAVRAAAAEAGLKCKMQGKSLQISGSELRKYMKQIAFNTEEALDAADFFAEQQDIAPKFEIEHAELQMNTLTVNSMYIKARAELPDDEEATLERFYSELSDALQKYDMGIIK